MSQATLPPADGSTLTSGLISVIVTVKNGAEFIEATIASLLAQTDGHFEVVVIDDGSTDDTLAVLSRFRDSRLRVEHRARLGRAAALAEAARLSRGEFLAVLDADDIALPDRFAKQRAYLSAHSSVALIGSAAIDFDEHREWRRRVVTGPARVRRALGMYNPFYHSSVMLRRSAYDAVGGYRPDGGWGHDKDLVVRIAKRYDVDILPEPLIRYRHHRAQLTVSDGETFRRRKSAALQLRAARDLSLPAPLWIVPLSAWVYAQLPSMLRPTFLKAPVKGFLLALAERLGPRSARDRG